jgi:hypothetical protein
MLTSDKPSSLFCNIIESAKVFFDIVPIKNHEHENFFPCFFTQQVNRRVQLAFFSHTPIKQ